MFRKIAIATLFFFLSFSTVYSQLNLKIGVGASYVESKINQGILARFNQSNPDFRDGFTDMFYVFGLQGGLRYKTGPIYWEVTYQSLRNTLKATGANSQDEYLKKSLAYTFNHLDFGFELRVKKIGYGATIGYSFFNVETNVSKGNDMYEIFNDNILNSQFFLSFHIAKTDLLEVVLRPYAEIAWEEYYMGSLDKSINPTSTSPGIGLLEKVHLFGLSFIVYNGSQY